MRAAIQNDGANITVSADILLSNSTLSIAEGTTVTIDLGGIFNAEGATATLTNVTITGNEDMVCGGGGICNYGTILLDGCTITGNKPD